MPQIKEASLPNSKSSIPSYDCYRGLGGIINEKYYQSVLERAGQVDHLRKISPTYHAHVAQVEYVAQFSGILVLPDGIVDVYDVMRSDLNPDPDCHYVQMCDQRLFAEVLRMLGHSGLLTKVIEAHPNICFV